MARYVERAENVARIINVNSHLLLDLPRGVAPGWEPLIAIIGAQGPFEERYREYSERAVLLFLVGDPDNPGSILSSLHRARENCRTIRDSVPREGWELINELYLFAKDALEEGLSKRGRHAFLKRILLGSQTIAGMLAGTMNRDEGYHFLLMGRMLERADMSTRIIDVRSENLVPQEAGDTQPYDNIQWMSVLKSMTAYQMYRRSMQVRVRRVEVLRFLLQSEQFPRAFRYCIGSVEESLAALPRNEPALRIIGRLKRTVMGADQFEALDQASLHGFLDGLQLGLIELHDTLADAYFLPREEAVAA